MSIHGSPPLIFFLSVARSDGPGQFARPLLVFFLSLFPLNSPGESLPSGILSESVSVRYSRSDLFLSSF